MERRVVDHVLGGWGKGDAWLVWGKVIFLRHKMRFL